MLLLDIELIKFFHAYAASAELKGRLWPPMMYGEPYRRALVVYIGDHYKYYGHLPRGTKIVSLRGVAIEVSFPSLHLLPPPEANHIDEEGTGTSMTAKTKKKSAKTERHRAWRKDAYERYARQAEFKNIGGAYPVPIIHKKSVLKGIENYLWEYVDRHGRLPRGTHQIQKAQADFGCCKGSWEVRFPRSGAIRSYKEI